MEKPTFEQLRNITSQVREQKNQKNQERIQAGRDDAIKHITEGCFDKMTIAAGNGLDKIDIYSFFWVEDPNDVEDKYGNKTVFEGNIRLLDLITIGNKEFISDLNKFFNTDGEEKYKCGVYKKLDNTSGIYSWNIYV